MSSKDIRVECLKVATAIEQAVHACLANGEAMVYLQRTDTGINIKVLTKDEVRNDQAEDKASATHH